MICCPVYLLIALMSTVLFVVITHGSIPKFTTLEDCTVHLLIFTIVILFSLKGNLELT